MSGPDWDSFVDNAKEWVEFARSQTDQPDYDWQPVAFLDADADSAKSVMMGVPSELVWESKRAPEPGDRGMVVMPLPGDPSQPDIELGLMLCMMALEVRRAMIVMTAFLSYDPDAREKYGGTIADAPSTVECVLILAFDKHRLEVWDAPIERHADAPPTLRPWHQNPGGGQTLFTSQLQGVMCE